MVVFAVYFKKFSSLEKSFKSAVLSSYMVICLGIESTAHTFGVAVLDGKKVVCNLRKSFVSEEKGMVPFEVAEFHLDNFDSLLREAFDIAEKEGIKMKDIDVIAFSQSPGLGHTLRIGAGVARSLALRLGKPLVGVNHCIAHLEIGRMLFEKEGCLDPVMLYVSGANTQVIAYESGKYRIFGETLDMGVGNFIDSFARDMGLGFPGGPKVEKLAKSCKDKDRLIELPYSVKGMDFSLGGLITNLRRKISSGYSKEELCYSMQEDVFAMLVEVAERAMAHTGKKELLLAGGVACNKRLQEMCRVMCEERGAKLFVPENEFLVDNAAMIAWLGILMFEKGFSLSVEESKIFPYLRTDEIEVFWR